MKQPVCERCISCQKDFKILVEPADYDRWRNGALIQNALPYLTAAERELLISRICGDCFDKLDAEDPHE